MTTTDNVECLRCGHRWHKETVEDDTPAECPRCYRESVYPIPPDPTVLDKAVYHVSVTIRKIPIWVEETKHNLILWKENHRFLIDMSVFAFAMALIFTVLYIVLFVWG